MLQNIVDYDTIANFTFPVTIEVDETDDVARLSQNPDGATFLATLQVAGGDAEVSADSVTATLSNGAVQVASRVEFRGAAQAIEWPFVASDPGPDGAVRIIWTPNFSGSSPALMTLFAFQMTGGTNNASVLRVRLTANFLVFEMFMQNMTQIFSIQAAVPAWVQGRAYEVEVNYDIIGGASAMFLDGVSIGTSALTGTRNTRDACKSGTLGGLGDVPDFDLDGVAVFATPQHTAGYAPTGVLLYSKADPTIAVNSSVLSDGLIGLAETVAATAPDEVRWVIETDGLAMWFDGADWATSDKTLAESNTVAVITANAASLNISAGAAVKAIAIIHSDDGDTTPEITQHVLTYDFFAGPAPDLAQCTVFGSVTDPLTELPIANASVIVRNDAFVHGEHVMPRSSIQVFAGADGRFDIALVETETIGLFPYTFVIGKEVFTNRQVPNTTAKIFDELLSN